MNNIRLSLAIFLFLCASVDIFAMSSSDNNKIINDFKAKYLVKLQNITKNIEPQLANKDLTKKLLIEMAEIDQLVRTDVSQKIYQNCEAMDVACQKNIDDANALMSEIDKMNLAILKLMLQKYTWFKISEFGEDGAQAAWLIVQHASDIGSPENLDLQIRVLFLMEHLLKTGEANSRHYALLHDRVSLSYAAFGLKQRYGSQFRISDNKKQLILEPYEGSLAEVEARRKSIGLEPLLKNAKQIANDYGIRKIIGLE